MPASVGSARVRLDETASERLRRVRARQRMRALDALCRDGRAGDAEKCAQGFASSVDKMRSETHENTNAETAKCEQPFAQNPFNNPFKTLKKENANLERSDDGGVSVKCDSLQADAWRRLWRAIGELESVRSGPHGDVHAQAAARMAAGVGV